MKGNQAQSCDRIFQLVRSQGAMNLSELVKVLFVETTLLHTPGFIKVKKNIFSFPCSFKYVMKELVPPQTQENLLDEVIP